jgi:cell wall-associated NlpC family hydrolase
MKAVLVAGVVVTTLMLVPAIFLIVLVGGVDTADACPVGETPTVSGDLQLDDASLRNAGTIIAEGRRLDVPSRGWVVALATAQQESTIHNLANTTVPESLTVPNDGVGHDHDSVGIFQQRANWGTAVDRMNVTTSADLFYARLVRVPNWQKIPLTVAAQAVQGSATPDAYARWELLAEQLVSQLADVQATCIADVVVSNVTGRARVVIDAVERNLGTLYQLNGDCSDSHSSDMTRHCDCSSLVKTAWAAANVTLPRTSEDQYLATTRISRAELQPGDLVFYNAGQDGRPGLPGHVALYLGGGKIIEAPQSGQVVSIRPLYSGGWLGAGRVA